MNNVTFVGNLTRDPELRFTNGGRAVCSFSVAVNRRWMNQQKQEWEEEVSYFECTAWADLGQNVSDSLSKGDRIVCSGRAVQESWETEAGDKRSAVKFVVEEAGPSLRWATAEVKRIPKGDGAPRTTTKSQRVSNEPDGDNEEPF